MDPQGLRRQGDTIYARATPPGVSGVAVVRLSGPRALSALLPLLRQGGEGPPLPLESAHFPPRTLQLCQLCHPDGGHGLDQVLMVHFPAPHSFTGEEMAEIHCHGSPAVLAALFPLLARQGLREADPGEFSRRAYLNGKLDLVQAEGLQQLLHAPTERAASGAFQQLAGGLSRTIQGLQGELLTVLAHLEASLDFSDEEIEPDTTAQLARTLARLADRLAALRERGRVGRRLLEGYEVAIVGRPNVGKSSLFNRLAGQERAIVTEIPGTTRDMIEIHLELHGFPLLLVDTAGLREAEERVEQAGIARALDRIQGVDGVLFLLDAVSGWTQDDQRIQEAIGDRPRVVVWNKMDRLRDHAVPALPQAVRRGGHVTVAISAATGEGLEALQQAIGAMLGLNAHEGQGEVVMAARQVRCLEAALAEVREAASLLAGGHPPELAAIPIREALGQFGELVGSVVHDDMLDIIFAQFCIGK